MTDNKEDYKKQTKRVVYGAVALGTAYWTFKHALRPMGKLIKGFYSKK